MDHLRKLMVIIMVAILLIVILLYRNKLELHTFVTR